ncbi:hypothetical protein FJU30_12060 [Affinibrenneria salicis]|uniref:DKNYY family protein n=1 Tax=Affinibrenneria salicis TaxID=2590031 RepID=A0A5J5G0Z9_9GAMM|nr:DKNYY domain-containing protein [Affinibrenneria salicis]KAA9000014.1 hypothetical protein FJU30_12060 [Affinibrenneria salicis]
MADEWIAQPVAWYGDYAFIDGYFLADFVDPRARLQRRFGPFSAGDDPQRIAQALAKQQHAASPLARGETLYRHRDLPFLLRGARQDYYLSECLHTAPFYWFVEPWPLPFRLSDGLRWCYAQQEKAACYYLRDDTNLYAAYPVSDAHSHLMMAEMGTTLPWFTRMNDVDPDRIAPLPLSDYGLLPGHSPYALLADGEGVYRAGVRLPWPAGALRRTNHNGYLWINDQLCRSDTLKPLSDKQDQPLTIRHPERFRMLSDRWGTDGEAIIVQAQQGSKVVRIYYYTIDGVDLATFRCLNSRYSMDAQRAWYITGKTIRHHGNFRLLREYSKPGGSHAAQVDSDYFAVDDRYAYCCGQRISGADGASFRHLCADYYRDDRQVFYRNRALDVDADSFIAVWWHNRLFACDRHRPLGSTGNISQQEIDHWRDFFVAHPQYQPEWWTRAIAQQDEAESELRAIGHGFQAGRRLYFHRQRLDDMDVDSFRLLTRHLCGDRYGLYLIPYHSPESRVPARFSAQPVSEFHACDPHAHYFSDGRQVWCHNIFYSLPDPIKKADPATFLSNGFGWAIDKRNVYYQGRIKRDLPAAETQLHGRYAHSRSLLFCAGKRVNVTFSPEQLQFPHPSFVMIDQRVLLCERFPISASRIHLPTLTFLNDYFARDRENIYYYDGVRTLKTLTQADYASFAVGDDGQAQDCRQRYNWWALTRTASR